MSKRKTYNFLSIVFITLLLISIGYVWYEYIRLTGRLGITSTKDGNLTLPIFKIISKTLGVAIIVNIGITLLTVVMLVLGNQSSEVQVVYVKKSEEEKYRLENNTDEQNDDGSLLRNAAYLENIIAEDEPDLKQVFVKVLTAVCRELEASQAAFFVAKRYEDKRVLELFATYAYYIAESKTFHYEFGEGLAGQVAKEGKLVTIRSIPEGYITILSGLGKATPAELIIAPVIYKDHVIAVLEIASFKAFTRADEAFVEETARLVSKRLANRFSEEEITSLVAASDSTVN